MQRRQGMLGEVAAGALAGAIGMVLAGALAGALERAVVPGPGVQQLLAALGSPLRKAALVAVPELSPTPAPLWGFAAVVSLAVALGALFAALMRNVRAPASVTFWSVLVAGGLTALTGPKATLLAAVAAAYGLSLALLSPLRILLAVPYEPPLRSARSARRARPPDTPFEDGDPYASYEVVWQGPGGAEAPVAGRPGESGF